MGLDHLQFLRGSDSDNDGYTGLDGELTVDKSNKGIRVHDGSTSGGSVLVPEEMTRVADVAALKNLRPTDDRFVVVDGRTTQFDGSGGIAVWDPNANASNANGVTQIASNVSGFQDGDVNEGLWIVLLGLIDDLKDFGQAQFDGNDTKTKFKTSHNINVTPESWRVTPVTDDASGFSHADADDQEITFYYDFPPPSGTSNVVLNWVVERRGTVFDLQLQSDIAILDGETNKVEYCIPHGLKGTPSMWQVEALTDDASGISHVTADSVNLCVKYDSPPPAGSNNIQFNWFVDPGTFNQSNVEDGGSQTESGDGNSITYNIPHNLGAIPEFAVVTTVSDDASGINHIDYDSSNITVNYSSPPPAGTDNLEFSFFTSTTDYASSTDESGGVDTFSGDGLTTEFTISHGLSSMPQNAIVTESNPDAAGISHVSYDSSVIRVFYDTPPANGSSPEVNWYAFT